MRRVAKARLVPRGKIEKSKLRIIFFGTPDFVVPIAQKLYEYFNLVGVVTTPDRPDSHKKTLVPSPVKHFAMTVGVPAFTFEQFNNETMQQLSSLRPDLFVTAAYGKILPLTIIDMPRYGSLNIHPSLLPKYRGTSPIQIAILNGDRITGVSIMKMDEKMDNGPILTQWERILSPTDTFQTLHRELFLDSAGKLPQIITDYIAGKITPQNQNESEAIFCQKVKKEDGYFESSNPPDPIMLDKMIRAYFPWPTAWTKVMLKNNEGKIMKLLPGRMIQLEGGKAMNLKDAINGYPELRQLLEQLLLAQMEQGQPQ